ncbi:VCBS repeat-containing protein [Sphingopyxis italica]|uniref:VCBS repeat-containing protein n=1 Tax=Sphingopyxis italica TaxID=1129133 RepID=A0A7X5XW36_9SPHN|nr:VCBS domain-containing protein [Sphingopyxis italica]NJB90907.1 VCBS repeat-containing protein [Sphingopyxis italica]
MDAFDNPVRDGIIGPQHDGASADQTNKAAPDSDFLAAAAYVTATASALPLAIQAILVPDASGRIVLPAGASIDDVSVSGADLIVTLPNGQVLIIPNGAVDIPSIVIDGDTVPASTVAQLLDNLGELNPEAGVRSSGGNFADPEGPIQDAYALGDLLPYTELAFSQPEDRELLPAIPDDEPEVVILTPDQPAGAAAATASVDEAGLPVREGEPAGSDSAANSETTTGSIVYDASDGLDAITINGTAITAVGQVIATPLGQLTITSLTPGQVGYSYTLADNSDANADPTDVFTVVVTDRDGDTATATLTIDVIDDVPTARADTDAVPAGSFAPEAGNVLTGAGTTSGAAGADTPGADDAALTGIRGADGEGGFAAPGTVQGQYGALTIGADGGYSYVRDPGTPGGVDDVFTYQITDGDGDTSTATLTIRIADAPTVITFVPGEGDDGTIVYEADLPGRDGETPGSAFGGGGGGGASTSGTITFTAVDGVGSVAIGGTTLNPGALPQTISSDATGTLVVTGYSFDPATGEGSVTYVYTLIDNTLDGDGTTVSFDLIITDADGDAASDTLDIMIVDDAPTARADSDSVAEDGAATADGNVLMGLGGGDANATDGVADTQGADGAVVTGVAGGSVGEPLAGAYGVLTLNGDGSYSYVLDNASQPVQGLSAGEVLTEIFTYTITDGDGDTSATTLTITINGTDDGVTVDGLDAEGAELTVDEDDLGDGSSPDAAALTQDGSFNISTPDGLGNVTVGGVPVVTNGVFAPATVPSPLGTVNVTGFTPVTGADGSVVGGTFTYEYILADNTLTHGAAGEDSVTDSFDVLVTDSDGSSANASLDVRIIDDVPTARDDADSVTEDGAATADGNVLTGLGGGDANATDGVADTQGADGASVTAVTGGTIGAAFATTYGTLTLNADGSYSYVLDNAAQAVQGLSAGEVLTDSVTYTITDGDGDTATATLTITINGADDGVTIEGLDADGAELSVDEDDLPARAGEAPGSDAIPDGVTDGDSFSVSTPDGMGSVILDSFNGVPLGAPLTLVTADGGFTPQSIATAYGTLAVTGFTPVTGADGSVIGGSFTYTYTLNDNRTDHPAAGQDDRTDSVGVTVTDADGSSASAAIDIGITDDVPGAIDDGTVQTVENAPVTIDVLANDVQGADSVQPSAVALVAGSLTGTGTLVNNGDGSFTYTPAAQESGTVSFQYRITDGDGDSDVATATITLVADSAPRIRNAQDVTVDEDGLAGANVDNGLPGETTSTGSASAAGTITVDFGSDVPGALAGSLVLNDSPALDTQLTVGGAPVTFAKDGADLVGSVGGNEVIRIALTTAAAGPGATEVTYGYSVTLAQAVDQALPGVEDSDLLAGIGFTVTDNDGTQSSGAFGVTIVDDLPTLNLSDTPTSVVEGATVNGSWTLDVGADGVTSVAVTFGSGSATLALTPGSSVSIAQPTGTLTVSANGSFSFAATGDQNDAANPSASFTLSAVDRDGDPTSDSLTIAIADGANPVGAAPITLTVNEAAINGIGSDPASNAETASGNLSFTAGSDTLSGFAFTGVADLTASLDGTGTDIFWMLVDGQTITGSLTPGGPAAITISLTAPASIAPGAPANASVTVTLADNLPHAIANAAQTQGLGNVTVQASDTDGDLATGVVTVQVTDDIPAAKPDTDSVAEDGALIADGNVLTGGVSPDANATDGVADTPGADGASVTALAGGTVGAPLVSAYGTLTLNSDGSYSYALDNANSSVQGLSAGQTLTEIFTYTITDGDGDPATTTLTILINGANDGVTINGLAVPGGEEVVNEDDLPDGSSPDAAALTQTGAFTIDAPDGLDDVTIGAVQVMTNGVFTPGLTTTSPLGTVTITGFTPLTAADGSVIGGTFSYAYVLDDNTLTHPAAGEDDVTDSFAVTVTDSDGSVGNASLDVRVIDDVPAASPEPNQNVAEGATVTGTLDFVAGADGASVTAINSTALVFGMDGFSQIIDIGDGSIKVKADGSYSFTADAAVPGTGSASATYTVTDGDGDAATAAISFTITDANAPTAGETQASVDDDALAGGNPASMTGDLADPNGDGDNDQATFSGLLNLDFGGDGAGSVNFAAMDGLSVSVGQESVQLAWNAGTNTLTATGPRGALFTVELTNPATGAYQVTLLDNVLHTPGGDENDASVVLGFTVIDSDGSTAPGTLRIAFDDDAPTVVAGTVQPTLTVDESNFAGDDGASFASVFTPAFGADGAAAANSVTYALGIGAGATGLVDSATNEAVVLVLNGNIVEGRTATTNALVFTVGVAANGTVTLDQSRAVMHTPDSGPDQPAGLSADNLITLTATVTDADGDTATATANIGQNLVFKDDAPVANDDSAGLTEGGPASVIFDVDTNDSNGADGFGSRSFTSLTGSYGTITVNPDGTQTYTLTPAGQAAIDALAPGATLTDIFTYTLTDKDGDSDPATLTVTLTGADDGVTITNLTPKLGGGDATVDEDDLPAGSDTTKESLTTTGSFNISAPDGVANLSIHGVQLINNGVFTPAAIPTPLGNMLNITAYNAATGEVSYSYTLNAAETHPNVQGENSLFEDFTVELTDSDGDDTDSLLSIAIVDDVPTARPDTDAVAEDAPGGATGNVITGIGTTNAPGSADTAGADGAAVTGVAAGTSATAVAGNVGAALGGSYGSLTLNAGGGYTYTLSNGNAAVQALGVGETLTETFTYTITDGDGDQATTTLKITINGTNDLPTIGTAATAVSDEGLAGGLPDGAGTVDTTNLTLRTGTITVGDPDGDPLTLSLGAPATALFSGGQPIVWDTANPQLLLGKVGTDTIISVAIDNGGNYSVTLSGPIDHPDTTQEDALSLVVPVSVFDGTTTVTNTTALTIGLEDDAPIAIAPLAAGLINAPGSSVYQSLDSDGDVDNNYGGDGPGSVIFTAATIAALQGQNLTAGGQALTYVLSADGTVLTAEKPNGDDVFIIRLQPAGHANQYQVEMVQKLDSTATIDFDDGGYDFNGGNTSWAGFSVAGDNNSQDLLLTPMTGGVDGGTVNTNNGTGGIGAGQSVDAGEAMRVDFVVDLTGSPNSGQSYAVLANQNHAFDSHYNANGASALFTNIGSSSSVRLVARDDIDTDNDIGDGVKDTITKVAISFNNATLSVTANGTYNVGGQDFTVTFANDEATVAGVVTNTVVAGFTADGYNSIEFHHAGGDTFKIGDFGAVVQTENPVNFNVPVTIVDGDGDTAPGSLAITTAPPLLVVGSATDDDAGEPTDHVVANPQGQPDGAIAGGAFDDTLVGDPGSVTITEGQQANIVLVLDSSGSMTTQIDFGNTTISRMDALKNGVNALIDSLAQSGAKDVRITVIDFDGDGDNLGTFDLIVNGVVQTGEVDDAKDAVDGMSASGSTNYEDGLQEALGWINGGNGIAGADVNKVVFVSDGNPTVWNSGGNGSDSDATNVQNSMDQVLGIDDSTNEPQLILATGYSIDSVGVNVNSTLLARLSDVEDGNASGGTGSATNAASAEELAAVLQVLGGSTDLAAAGNDTINGGGGADVIFGDVLYTDTLAADLGVNLSSGSGWAVFQTLEGRVSAESIDPAGNGADWNRQDTIAYVRANYAELAQESGRTGGHDTISAGDGNDVILGQEGNDIIDAGGGDDLIAGGTGRDVMAGGAGSDSFVFNAGESRPTLGGSGNAGTITGHDVITDFDLATDILNLPGTPVADGDGIVNGINSGLTIGGEPVRSHSVTNGVISFDDNNSFTVALDLSSDARVAAAVDYLQSNNIGPAGTTVAFVAGTRTFVYQQVGTDPDPVNDILVELQGVTITNLNTLIGTRVTPVTLDLGGDGLDFVSAAAGAAFDHDGDSVREATSWAGRGDGILVRDANGDGIANDGGEISFSVAGSTDLEGLRLQYDSNGDGQLSTADTEFASFGVWQDANGDGVTDAGEFRSLADLGIASIALTSDEQAYVAGDGEVIVHGEASFTRTDGSGGAVGDVSFITPRAANDADRTAGNQALTGSLVAASLIAIAHDERPDGPATDKTVSENVVTIEAADESGAPALTEIARAVAPHIAAETAPEREEDARSAPSTTAHDDAAPASIDADRGDWRTDAGGDAGPDDNADALFDQVADHAAPGQGLMDGLLALAALPADATIADAAAPEPAATAVLAEVLEGANAIDQLIDTVAGAGTAQEAAEAPAFDLAQLLDQSVILEAGIVPHPTIEQELHQLATA